MKLFSGKRLGIHCPYCRDGEKVIRQNRTSGEFFVSCTGWPDCNFSENLPEDLRLRVLDQTTDRP